MCVGGGLDMCVCGVWSVCVWGVCVWVGDVYVCGYERLSHYYILTSSALVAIGNRAVAIK